MTVRPPSVPPARRPADSGREFLHLILDDPAAYGHRMAVMLHEKIPELAAVPEARRMFEETERSCVANVTEILRVLEGELEPQDAVLAPAAHSYVASAVHRRITLAALLRAYRVGQNHLWNEFVERTQQVGGNDPAALRWLADVGNLLFEYIDRISGLLAEVYEDERALWVRSASAVRSDTVTEILERAPDLDVGVASNRLGYDLRGRHVAFVVSRDHGDATGPAQLEATADEVARALGGGSPLVLPIGATALWAWTVVGELDDGELLRRCAAHEAAPGILVAVGHTGSGVDGFRVSHVEAQRTAVVRELLGGPGAITAYGAVELLSLLTADVDGCMRFVLRRLGPLAERTAAAASLRETALAYLDHGGSHLAAAHATHLHKNTVYTRIRRAERILGTPIVPGDADLHDALRLAAAFPDRLVGDED